MSKIIKMTPEYIEEGAREFAEALRKAKVSDGKFTFTKTFGSIKRKATLAFTEEAWIKMMLLLQGFDSEVAWHGVASRDGEDKDDRYLISDILVYPQTVSGAYVDMDAAGYEKWVRENDGDPRFDNLFFQAHSHVNMSPSPSPTDLHHQEEILADLRDDDFYVFMIINKSYVRNIKIYDMRKNVLFENEDITVSVASKTEWSADEWLKNAKSTVKPRIYTSTGSVYSSPTAKNAGSGGYQNYSDYVQKNIQSAAKTPATADGKTTPKTRVVAVQTAFSSNGFEDDCYDYARDARGY